MGQFGQIFVALKNYSTCADFDRTPRKSA